MTRAVKSPMPSLLPKLKIPSAEQFARESEEQALFRETLEALDAGTPAQVIVHSMMKVGMPEQRAITMVRDAALQLPVARHNAELFLESRGEPQWCGAKAKRMGGAFIAVLGVLSAVALHFAPQNGVELPQGLMVLGEHTWTIAAAAALLGVVLSALGARGMKRVRRAALTRRP